MMSEKTLRIGTRRSLLAKAQTQHVVNALITLYPNLRIEVVEVVTTGDRILDTSLSRMPGKGVFVKEIEEKLLADEIDLAVHSMKDLPTEFPDGLSMGAILQRVDPRDVLVTRHNRDLEEMPEGTHIGTSSLRRKAQLMHARPDLDVIEIRGNIDTRLQKSKTEDFDGILLAAAGLIRMRWQSRIKQYLSCETMIPAVGQGALGIEIREDDDETRNLLRPLHDETTALAVEAERIFLQRMGGGCQTPMAAFCRVRNGDVTLHGFCAEEDGSKFRNAILHGTLQEAAGLAQQLAEEFLEAEDR